MNRDAMLRSFAEEDDSISEEVLSFVKEQIAKAISKSMDRALIEYATLHGHLPWDLRPLPFGCQVCKSERRRRAEEARS